MRKNIKKIKYGIASLLIGIMFACDSYVDVVPDNLATIDIAFNSRVNAEKFFYTLYGYMPSHAQIETNPAIFGGDELWSIPSVVTETSGLDLALGLQSVASPKFDYWTNQNFGIQNLFIALRDCNIFLENIYQPRDMTEFERSRWIAEAKFLKAYYHFWLLRQYGAIPTIKENIDVSSGVDVVRVERDKADETIAYIVSLLDEAILDLPPAITSTTSELGRVTQPIAASIKAKILAWSASPLMNGNTAYANWVNSDGEPYINQTFDHGKWELAAEACREAVNLSLAGGHSLYKSSGVTNTGIQVSDSTRTKLSIRGAVSEPWNSELIWGLFYDNADGNAGFQAHSYGIAKPGLSGNDLARARPNWAPTLRIAELFYSDNGVPIEEDTSFDYFDRYSTTTASDDYKYYIEPGYTTAKLHFNREPRFHADLFFDGGKVYGQGQFDDKSLYTFKNKAGELGGKNGPFNYSITGYLPKKMSGIYDELIVGSFPKVVYPFPIIRLADMYLLLAECSNEAFGPSQEVYDNLDVVRERAGLEGVVSSWAAHSKIPAKPTSKDGLREIIHQERLIELTFEGHRFWDLRRWLKAQRMLNNSDIKGWNVEGETNETYYQIQTLRQTKFSFKDHFWPISEADIISNPNLTQSPGW
ncbi:RagB/SusD family nutrient uptake outer membrane protein [Tamlana agarivorans]|uniref:RagB/SusD family nutrient uptake outer membrane protein n=1 Tax=Pseudotamlana agarivorans TaxID=481183 RepID=A0ACC5U9P7_9FLAO|nr:RagB/SusD family nutrient uptake outer membrane protein [Tamlana agarivorans]MBU2950920.1 RagB/SusD family nutrient uptake outer membrane protein [Tamlana agarivorans]